MKNFVIGLLLFGILIYLPDNKSWAEIDSIEKLKKAVKTDPKDYAPHFALGHEYHAMGLYNKAVEEYKKAIKLEPLFAAAFNGLGASYGELSEFDKAVEAYLEATHLGPNYAQAQYGLGFSYFQLEEYDKALLPLKIAIKVQPKI